MVVFSRAVAATGSRKGGTYLADRAGFATGFFTSASESRAGRLCVAVAAVAVAVSPPDGGANPEEAPAPELVDCDARAIVRTVGRRRSEL